MDVILINRRVDEALGSNRRAETTVIAMSSAVFFAGLIILAVSYWIKSPYVAGGAALLNGFIYWPIREIIKIRRDNVVLQVVPAMVAQLPPKEAAQYIGQIINWLKGDKS